jgi:hypothetical protein
VTCTIQILIHIAQCPVRTTLIIILFSNKMKVSSSHGKSQNVGYSLKKVSEYLEKRAFDLYAVSLPNYIYISQFKAQFIYLL